MNSITKQHTALPPEAHLALDLIRKILAERLAACLLFGSAVEGGLSIHSDVDLLALTDRPLAASTRRRLVAGLLQVSGSIGNQEGRRPIELTIINLNDIRPWRYPPRREFQYGEWLREELEAGATPDPTPDPDLAILLTQVRQSSLSLQGPPADELIEPIPREDLHRAIKDSLPALLASFEGDERNVLLTLARMWVTAATGGIVSKDAAAEWAMRKLPPALSPLLAQARAAYLGQAQDAWDEHRDDLPALLQAMEQAILACLDTAGPRQRD